jgi:hypothetical protein
MFRAPERSSHTGRKKEIQEALQKMAQPQQGDARGPDRPNHHAYLRAHLHGLTTTIAHRGDP